MEKKKIFYSKPVLDSSDLKCLKKVFDSTFLTQGPFISKFEEVVAKYVNAKFAVSLNSATSALHAACYSLGFKANDILWTVPNTFVGSANCAKYLNGKVNFVDINFKTKNIDIDLLKKKLESTSKKKLPKILITVDFGGNPVNQDEIYKLSNKYGFKIIEDASHALGSIYKKQMVGSCKWSNITVFSFHPVKTITTGEGGMVTTNSKSIYEKLLMFRSHGITRKKSKMKNNLEKKNDWYYEQQFLGFNYRLTDIAAALGLNQMKKIKKIIIKRNQIAKFYNSELKSLPLALPFVSPHALSTYHLYSISILHSKHKLMQKKLYDYLKINGIIANLHYLPVHLHPYYREQGFKVNDYPASELHANSSLSIPLYPDLSLENQKKITTLIKEFFKRNIKN
jgi:UDP-4-amino-4,6-dideoxy-N-acetyl-beta-L-altrosamine transaminase